VTGAVVRWGGEAILARGADDHELARHRRIIRDRAVATLKRPSQGDVSDEPHTDDMTKTQTSSPIITRLVDGVQVPVAGSWKIDPGHAEVAFIGRHFMLTKVRGRFTDVAGTIEIADDPADSSVSVTIGTASVTSGSVDRDNHLRSSDFFAVDRFPTATFRSHRVNWSGTAAKLDGELTIVGVTRPVELDVELVGTTVDPWGGGRAVFSAFTEIDREDWGLTWNVALETGGILVSKRIRIEIELEAVLEAPNL
jgi:polyisoprenoid-binding protein YceI